MCYTYILYFNIAQIFQNALDIHSKGYFIMIKKIIKLLAQMLKICLEIEKYIITSNFNIKCLKG